MSRPALLGPALADTALLLGPRITTAVGFLVGFRIHGSVAQALAAFGLCVVYGFAFTWLFVLIGLVAGNAQAAQGMSLLVFPLTFVSSAYVPVDSMPGWLQPFAEHQPLTVMINAVRGLVLGDPEPPGRRHSSTHWVCCSLLWSAGLLAVFAPAGGRPLPPLVAVVRGARWEHSNRSDVECGPSATSRPGAPAGTDRLGDLFSPDTWRRPGRHRSRA